MKERRDFLKALPLAALGAATLGLADAVETAPAEHPAGGVFDPRRQRSIPNVPGVTHAGQPFQFYRDLIQDKVVAINFMSIREEPHYPVTARMAEIAKQLGPKLGREVFMVSVTRDPEHDTPERLAEFVKQFRVPKGWLFVNCSQAGCDALQARIYHLHHMAAAPLAKPPASHPHFRSTDTVFYGNGGVGVWGNFPVELSPAEAVRHIAWVLPGVKPAGLPRRAGPRRLHSPGLASDNRIENPV